MTEAATVVRAGETDVREWRLKCADGSYLPVEIRVSLLPDGSWLAVLRDISARRTLEREAAERARQVESMFNAIADGVIHFDPRGDIVQTNAALRAMFALDRSLDYTTESISARSRRLHVRDENGREIPTEQLPPMRALRGEILTATGAQELRMRALDGRELTVDVSAAPIHDGQGRIVGAVAVYRDVTKRRLLEQRALETVDAVLALAGAALEPGDDRVPESPATGDASDPATAHGVIGRIAALTARALGCHLVAVATIDPATEIMRPMMVAGLAPEDEARWWAGWAPNGTVSDRLGSAVADRLRTGEVVKIDMDDPAARKRLAPFHLRTLFVAPMLAGRRLVGALAIDDAGVEHTFTDRDRVLAGAVGKLAALVLERERLLREREEAGARALALEEANRRMDQFLGIAAHELRTPVTSMSVNLKLLLRRAGAQRPSPSEDDDYDLLDRTNRQMARLTRLVDDLVDMSRIQTGGLEMRMERCDLLSVVREEVEGQRLAHPARVIALRLPSEGRAPVVADADRMGQVVANYVTNALKYSRPPKPVEVRLDRADGRVRVSVRDEGPGIAPEEHARIWEVFHRAPGIEVQSGSGVGLGLGLHIAKTIVERHGGAVGVESAPGVGSTFWFTLPLAARG